MAFDPGYWDDDFEARYRAAMMGGQPVDLGVSTTEYPLGPVAPLQPPPPPPPPPPPERKLATPGAPVTDEVPLGALPPPMPEAAPPELAAPPLVPVQAPAPAPALAVDAISGVDQRPPDDAFVSTAPIPTEKPEEALTPEELGAKWSALPFEQQEMIRGKVEGAKQNLAASRMLEESTLTRKRAEETARDYEEAVRAANQRSAELDVEAKRIASEDPLDRIPTWRKLAGILGAIVGGFGANVTGRNMGLEAVTRIAEEAGQAHAQRLQLNARQQTAIGDQLGRAGDLYKAQETVRIATFDSAIKTLESEVQNFDPRGTTALRVMDQVNAMKAKRAELMAKYRNEELKRAEGLLKEQRELAQLQETQRHNIAGEKTDATRAYADLLRAKAEDKKASAEATTFTPEYFAQSYGSIVPPDLLPKRPMTEKQFQQQLESSAKGREAATKLEARRITGVMPDGGDFVARAGSDEVVAKARDQVTASKSLVRLIDNARRIRTGWSSDLAKNKEWQELKTIWANAKGKGKNALGLGAMSDSDFELVGQYLGTDDPTKRRGVDDAIKKARQLIISDANDALRSVGYEGTFDIKDVQANAPVASTDDKQLAFVLRGQSSAIKSGEATSSGFKPTPEQINMVNVWAGALAKAPDDATRQHYADMLGQVAAKAQAVELRDAARQALLRVSAPAAPTEELEPEVR